MLDHGNLQSKEFVDDIEFQRSLNKTIKKVREDVAEFKFNTALASLMSLTNDMAHHWDNGTVNLTTWNDSVTAILLLLAPIAPHISEELWEKTGHVTSIHTEGLPNWDSALAYDETITLVLQINGKVRDRVMTTVDITQSEAEELALASYRVQQHLENRTIKNIIFVPGRLVNIVIS